MVALYDIRDELGQQNCNHRPKEAQWYEWLGREISMRKASFEKKGLKRKRGGKEERELEEKFKNHSILKELKNVFLGGVSWLYFFSLPVSSSGF